MREYAARNNNGFRTLQTCIFNEIHLFCLRDFLKFFKIGLFLIYCIKMAAIDEGFALFQEIFVNGVGDMLQRELLEVLVLCNT